MNFAEWLQGQMAEYSLTIYQISKRSGVHQTTIKNWLDGAKPQETKSEAVKAAVIDLVQERRALIDSLPWEQLAKKQLAVSSELHLPENLSDDKLRAIQFILSHNDDEIKRFMAVGDVMFDKE